MRGYFHITRSLLVQMLHLPDGTRLVEARNVGDYIEIVIEHADLPGGLMELIYRRDADGTVEFSRWKPLV